MLAGTRGLLLYIYIYVNYQLSAISHHVCCAGAVAILNSGQPHSTTHSDMATAPGAQTPRRTQTNTNANAI